MGGDVYLYTHILPNGILLKLFQKQLMISKEFRGAKEKYIDKPPSPE
jgi:hypothetical protein